MLECGEPRGGGLFSDDGDVYLCAKCVAFHDEYMWIMAKSTLIERRALTTASGTDHPPNRRTGAPADLPQGLPQPSPQGLVFGGKFERVPGGQL
jgi:hypothetical protein